MSTEVSKEIFETADPDNRSVTVTDTFTDPDTGKVVGGYKNWSLADVRAINSLPATGLNSLADLMHKDYIEKYKAPERSYEEAVERAWEDLRHDKEKTYVVHNMDKLDTKSNFKNFAETLEDTLTRNELRQIRAFAEAGFDFQDLLDELAS